MSEGLRMVGAPRGSPVCVWAPRAAAGPLHRGVARPPTVGLPLDHPAAAGWASACFASASIAASDLRTWLRSVVYQKSGSDAFR